MTLKDISKELGIAVSTVSKALRDYHEISDITKEKVKALAAKNNFTPNSIAINLRKKETKTIGLIVPNLNNAFFISVIKGILKEGDKNNYFINIKESQNSFSKEKECIDYFLYQKVDGILICLSEDSYKTTHLNKIRSHNIPLILFGNISKAISCSKIIVNNQKVIYNVIEHLSKKDKTKIALIRSKFNSQKTIERFVGYKKALDNFNFLYDQELTLYCDLFNKKEAQKQLKTFFNKIKNQVDAIFIVNNAFLIDSLKHLISNNSKIDVICFSNDTIHLLLPINIILIKRPGKIMGQKAFQQFLIEKELLKQKKEIIPKIIELEASFKINN